MLHRLTRPLIWLVLVAMLSTSMPAAAHEPAPPTTTSTPPPGTSTPPTTTQWPFPVTQQPPPPAPMPLLDGDAARNQPPPSMPQPTATPPITATPPAPVTKTLEPPPEVHRPSLALDLAVAPAILMVGEAATFTITVHNLAADPADDLVLTVPVPDKVVAQSGPTTQGNHGAWRWELGHLDGQAQTTVSATFKVTGALRGQAVVLVAQATARDVATPAAAQSGAIVLGQPPQPKSAAYTPGAAATLTSADGMLTVSVPAGAAETPLTLAYTPPDAASNTANAAQHTKQSQSNHGKKPPKTIRGRRGFGTFTLDATDPGGNAVHQFTQPLTLTLRYTPEQLAALGLAAGRLTLFWFDEAQQQWVAVPSTVDPQANTVTAQVDHFSAFQLGDQRTPSEAYVPALQGFQASLFTGAASYRIPIEVPAGPGGLTPDLALSYSSAATDGPGGETRTSQAGWVGKGWSLDAGGFVALNISNAGSNWNHFSLVFGGRAYDVVRGELTNGCTDYYDTARLECWTWHATDEGFVKVRALPAGGGYTWRAWTPDGTRYDFTQQLWTTNAVERYVYKWLLTQVTDTHGNRIVYTYLAPTVQLGGLAYHPAAAVQDIFWAYDGATPGTGTPRYNLHFGIADRFTGATAGVDTQWEYPLRGTPGDTGFYRDAAPHELYRLDWLAVQSMQPGLTAYELIRQYVFGYQATQSSVATDDYTPTDGTTGQRTLTLASVQQVGSDWQTVLPATTFTYGMDAGSGNPRPAGYNRLQTITNGYGGTITFSYEHPWSQASAGDRWWAVRNYHRLLSALQQDITGQPYSASALTTYSYTGPAINDQVNSAAWWYARFAPTNQNNLDLLAHPEWWEFRGHASVTERTYDGATTGAALLREREHWFFQGNAGCAPSVTNNLIDENDACFVAMRDRESWKGREYQTDVRQNGTLLERTTHTFTRVGLPFYGSDDSTAGPSNHYTRAGLWRAFNATQQTSVSAYEGGPTPQTHTTIYGYDITTGNTTRIEERGESGATVRVTNRSYASNTAGDSYILDRVWGENVVDGAGNLLALTHRFYDNAATPATLGTTGDLTLERVYFNVPAACCANVTLQGTDTSSGYDQYGNRTTVTTYSGPGSYLNGSYSPPGSGSAARTTRTVYDGSFHLFPIRVENPLGHTESAEYDYRMGTLTRVTDANNQSTWAEYDVFGRITRLTQVPDDPSYGTKLFWYYDHEALWNRPVRYVSETRGGGPTDYYQDSTVFYDGLGRQVHTKSESAPWSSQAIIVDKRYDALGRLVAESQPRYVQEDGWALWYYTTANQPLHRPTTTSYDALDRPLLTTMPDGTSSEHHYGIVNDNGLLLRYDDLIDANRHRRQTRSDALGRLVQVQEISGDCGGWQYACAAPYTTPWAASAATTYRYDGLDQLTQTRDAAGNVITLLYDSAGRKLEHQDPDTGWWRYSYDANGNLQSQRDARGQTIWFTYDALDRLLEKRDGGPSGPQLAGYAYEDSWSPNSIGRRTRAWTTATLLAWQYDARGNISYLEQQAGGVTRYLRYSYDSANRLRDLNYVNTGEWVNYEYDMVGRPTRLCSNWYQPCYVSGATYTALGQITSRTRANGQVDEWIYNHAQSRLTNTYVGSSNARSNLSYTYDDAGNLTTITDWNWGQTQNFTYDHLDRLTRGWTTGAVGYPAENGRMGMAYDQSYSYDLIGNMTSKAGVTYRYPLVGYAHPHAPNQVGSTSYDYDLNGNVTRTLVGNAWNGTGRRYTWNAFNQLQQVEQFTTVRGSTSYSTLESYSYDADGERALRTANGQTTISMGGLWEETIGGTWRALYTFNGELIGATTNQAGTFTYLLGDRLGSATWSYNLQGGYLGGKEYAPWGEQRVALYSMLSEPHDFTGQRLDSTGLLYYHARYYDPVLGRFLSPDSVVPGAGALTLAPHDATAAELWQQKGGGPTNPQDLNRYAYALNNPVKNTDPTGHCIGPAAVLCLPLAATAAKAAFDAAVVAVGVYLVADGVQQIAATQAATQGQEGAAAPEAGQAGTPAEPKGGTYVLKDPETGAIERTGRTKDLNRREKEHARDPKLKDLQFDEDARTDDYAAQRGREQILHDKYKPPRNKIRPIRPNHPKLEEYLKQGGEVKGKY